MAALLTALTSPMPAPGFNHQLNIPKLVSDCYCRLTKGMFGSEPKLRRIWIPPSIFYVTWVLGQWRTTSRNTSKQVRYAIIREHLRGIFMGSLLSPVCSVLARSELMVHLVCEPPNTLN